MTLEVSADNGLHYTSVVNGIPCPIHWAGNRIKCRAYITPEDKLIELKLSFTDTSGVIGTFGAPELSGFKFRKVVPINGSSSEELFNYQMKIRVGEGTSLRGAEGDEAISVHCEGNIRADFRDIRFTAQDGETLLPYYLEGITGEKPNRVATFWVKIPQIPPEGIGIYIYYGNSQAEDLSNGEDVFDFFDDFAGEKLDAEKWEIYPELGSYELLNSQLKLDAAKVISKSYQIKDGIIEYRATTPLDKETYLTAQAGYEIRAIIRDKKGTPELTQLAYSSAYKEVEHSIVVGDFVKVNTPQPILPDTPYDYRIIAKGENITFERYGIASLSLAMTEEEASLRGATLSPSLRGAEGDEASTQASVSYRDVGGLKKGFIGLKTGSGSISYYDWLRVRKLAEPEPEITFSGKEEPTNLARFLGTTLTEDGNLIASSSLRGGRQADEAIYIPKVISTPFQTRIMVPSFTVADSFPSLRGSEATKAISLDISADGGKTYKTNCENGSYYYASRGDFTAGSNLRCRAVIARRPKADEAISKEGIASLTLFARNDVGLKEVSIDYRPGHILLVSPNGGDIWPAGTRQKILWLASDYEPTYPMRIEYSLDGGKTYNMIKRRGKNTGVCFWRIPRKLSGKKVLIKVSDALDEKSYDTSDGMLEIIEANGH